MPIVNIPEYKVKVSFPDEMPDDAIKDYLVRHNGDLLASAPPDAPARQRARAQIGQNIAAGAAGLGIAPEAARQQGIGPASAMAQKTPGRAYYLIPGVAILALLSFVFCRRLLHRRRARTRHSPERSVESGGLLNTRQLLALWAGIFLCVAMFLAPPWRTLYVFDGYHPLWRYPDTARIDIPMLALQYGVLTAVIGAALVTLRGRK